MDLPEQNNTSFFQTTTAKMIMVGMLTLVLLLPLSYVSSLIEERSIRQKEVVDETSQKWGTSVYFYGPILKIPYKDPLTLQVKNAYFFPDELTNTTTTTSVKPLQRSIYKSNVFTTKMAFSGSYSKPDFNQKNIPDQNVYWNQASIIIKTNNLKSIKDEVKIKLGNAFYTFEPIHNSKQNDSIESLETGFINSNSITSNGNFNVNCSYNGSKQIKIVTW